MKKRLIALLCAVVLCLSSVPARAINVGDVYFTALNLNLLPLSIDTMPTWVNGVLYVPASVFDSTVTGVDLGLYCTQSSMNNTVTLYTLKQMLVFDLSRGITYDHHSGQSISARAVNRNGRIYLPVEKVCDFFGLEDSYNYTQYGYLVRIKSEPGGLSDADFIDAASVPMASRLQELLRSQQTPVTPPPAVDSPVTPVDPPAPPSGNEDQPKSRVQVCLAFRCETGEGLEQILNRLNDQNCRGFFFFTPEQIVQQDMLVRRIVGSGHGIGILAQGDTVEDSRRILIQANELLSHVARTGATAALVPDEQSRTLEEENWVCWKETADARPRENERTSVYAQRILRSIGSRSRTVFLTLDDSRNTARVLPSLLSGLHNPSGQEDFRILPPAETKL